MKDGKFYDFYRGKDGKIGSPTFHSCICSTPNRSKKGIPIIATILFKGPFIAPTEVRCEVLKSSFFVVAVFLWSNRVIIRINMHREATRNPQMVPWGWGEGRKKYFCISLMFYGYKYFYLSTLLNSNRKTFGVNIDLN